MIITEDHLVPSEILESMYYEIADLEQKIDIEISVEDFVSINLSGEDAQAELEVDSRALDKYLNSLRSEVSSRQNTATDYLRRIAEKSFEEKVELFLSAKEEQPDLCFPIYKWVKFQEFSLSTSFVLDEEIFKYDKNVQCEAEIKENVSATLNYFLSSKDFGKDFLNFTNGSSYYFKHLDYLMEHLKSVQLNKQVDGKTIDLNVNTYLMNNSYLSNTAKYGLKRLMFAKAFKEDNLNLDSEQFKQLEKDFGVTTCSMLLEQMKIVTTMHSELFFLKGELEPGYKASSFQEESTVYSGVFKHVFWNIRDIFPEETSTPDFDKKERELIDALLKNLSRHSSFKESYTKEVIAALQENILLEISVPDVKNESVRPGLKF